MNSERNIDEFVRLFSLWTTSIYSYIHVLAPVHADAEDIFQETSKTLWEKFAEYRGGDDEGFRAWALSIARIEVMRHRQRRGRRRLVFDEQLQAALDATALAAADTVDMRLGLLGECYQKLPDEDRRMVDARYQIGSSVEKIAADTRRSIHSIYRALRRIHQTLFDCVQQGLQLENDGNSPKEDAAP